MDRPQGSDGSPVTVLLEDPTLPYPYQDGGTFNALDQANLGRLKDALLALPGYRFEFLERHDTLAADLAARRPRLVFNLCDTGWRNRSEMEAHIPALLEILDIPYSGAAPAALLICRDKALVRAAARDLGVPVPAERYLTGGDSEALDDFPYPAIVKPNLEEGSCGITAASVVGGPRDAAARIRDLRRQLPGSPLLLQEFLGGAEYSVGLIGNPASGLEALSINQVDYRGLDPDLPPILTFEFKNEPASRYASQLRYRAAELAPEDAAALVRGACRLFERLGCRDYARIDYRADAAGTVKLLEVNPNPAVVSQGSLQTMAARTGYGYPEFLDRLLAAARRRTGA